MIAARPLTIGEIFDRGITLFVRNAPLAMLLSTFYQVPKAIFAYFDPSSNPVTALWGYYVIGHSSAASAVPTGNAVLARCADVLLFMPIVDAALAAVLAGAHGREPLTLLQATRISVQRGVVVLLASLIALFALGGAAVAASVVLIGCAALGAALVHALGMSEPLSNLVIGIVVAPGALVALAAVVFLFTVRNVAICIAIRERGDGGDCFGTAWRRTLAMPLRAIVVTTALLAVGCVLGLIAGALGETISEIQHSPIPSLAFTTATAILVSAIVWAITVVYYEDQRIRSEGDDLVAVAAAPVDASIGTV